MSQNLALETGGLAAALTTETPFAERRITATRLIAFSSLGMPLAAV